MNNGLFKPLAPLVLPAVYDDVLSYEEWLSKVVYRINELNDYITKQLQDMDALVTEKVTIAMVPVNQEIQVIRQNLTDGLAQVNARLEADETETNVRFQQIESNITEINNMLGQLNTKIEELVAQVETKLRTEIQLESDRLNSRIIAMRVEVMGKLAEMERRLDEIIKEFPPVYDPSTGYYEDVETAIAKTYKALRYFAIKALKYDDQELTAQEYDDMALTAIEYDTSFLRKLKDALKNMFSPFTGQHENIAKVLQEVIDELRWNAKTTNQYDGYEYTAQEFDSSDFGAYRQDNDQYYTTPTEDNKNRHYRNYVLIADSADEAIDTVTFAINSMKELHVRFNDDFITLPLKDGTFVLPWDSNTSLFTVSINDTEGTISDVNSDVISIYGITYIKDVTELDK